MTYAPIRNQQSLQSQLFEKRCSPENLEEVPNSILKRYHNNFIVINKPPDCRLNGEFTVTVENLLLKWIPESRVGDFKW